MAFEIWPSDFLKRKLGVPKTKSVVKEGRKPDM
jgi:hypothetical protein